MELKEFLETLDDQQLSKIDELISDVVWVPSPGPQLEAFLSPADVLGYGGAAGGGKTDLAIGLAIMNHTVSAIFRREAPQLSGVIERLAEIYGGRDTYTTHPVSMWRLPNNKRIEFGSCPHPGDEQRHQGRQKDLLVIDEATGFLESQVRYLTGWVRTTIPGQRTRVLMTFNPPTDANGRWVLDYFAPWLRDDYPNPASPGELRWFATIDGKDTEVDKDWSAAIDGKVMRAISRTFIPAKVDDNPYLNGTSYVNTLNALPEPLRSKMLLGDFKAGMEDDAFQVIPTEWVDSSMKRWEEKDVKGEMSNMGVDVARGGADATVIARRHKNWVDRLIYIKGEQTKTGPEAAAHVVLHRRDASPVVVDIIGWGSSAFDFLKENGVQVIGHNGANATTNRSSDGQLGFANTRAEAWWRLRESLDPNGKNPLILPPDEDLKRDLTMPLWKVTPRGIQIESKDDIRKRLGRSPDRADAVALCNYQPRKAASFFQDLSSGRAFGASQSSRPYGLSFGTSQKGA